MPSRARLDARIALARCIDYKSVMTTALILAASGDALLDDGRPATIVPLPHGETRVAARELVRPGAHVAIVLAGDEGDGETPDFTIEDAIWGVAPRHVADRAGFRRRYRTHRARAETLLESRVFAPLWRRGQRCAIPLTGFSWWSRDAGGTFSRGSSHAHGAQAVLACGLYVPALAPDGSDMSAAIVVRESGNARLQPLLLPLAALTRWLDPASADAADLLAALPDARWSDAPR